ncbi:MAG: aspartate aminotransferase [Acidobacteria bacterium]|nr:aspartate aminotransferase [Acidobacteriota bacterium]
MLNDSINRNSPRGAFREVPYMGVIFVVDEAHKRGFWNGHPDWSNLGQGQPEVGPYEGAPPRIEEVRIGPQDHAYGRLEGTDELREAVATHYNRLYRRGMPSQYSADNVAIANGGRLALSRAMAALGAVKIGYQLPDYTAYEDMFNLHLERMDPIAVWTDEAEGFQLTPVQYSTAIQEHSLDAFIMSNPCNPTGNVIQQGELETLVRASRERRVTLLLDEFYSHFIYTDEGKPADSPVSAAAFLEDIEDDPVVLFDGLTKSFRYPGWRIGWVVGPKKMVESMARTASSIDGGPSRIAQLAAIQALEPDRADQETTALRRNFVKKRNLMLERLEMMGFRFARKPLSTFYCWASLDQLPEPFDDAMEFFWRALDHKVMTVPGKFFDVNPGKVRSGPSPYKQWMRFSFGPPMDNVEMGLDRIAEMLGKKSST